MTDEKKISPEESLKVYIRRYNSLTEATEKLQQQYIEAMKNNVSLTQQLSDKDTLIQAKQNTIQLLATEQNSQEQRHSAQVAELMSRLRILEDELNGNIN